MAKLDITANQKTLVLDTTNTGLESSFAEGVQTPGPTPAYDEMKFYADRLRTADKVVIKNTFLQVFAAFIKAMGFDQPGVGTAGTPIVIPLAPLTGLGSSGSLTIVGGLIVAHTDPT